MLCPRHFLVCCGVATLLACAPSAPSSEPARARAPASALAVRAGESGPPPLPGARAPRGTPDYVSEVVASRAIGPRRGWQPQRLWSPHVDWEPVVAADPSSAAVYQMAARYYAPPCGDCPDPIVVFRRSLDGGVTWQTDEFPFRDGRTQVDVQLRVSESGTLFAAWLQDWRPGVSFARSDDGGRTWSEPISFSEQISPHWSDHPMLAVSRDGRWVVLAFNNGNSWVTMSDDGGRTFRVPVRTDHDNRYWFHTGGLVDGSGNALVATVDYSPTYEGQAHIGVLRSADGGASWQYSRIDTAGESPRCDAVPGCYLGFLGPRADLAIDTAGLMMLVYNGNRRDGQPQKLWVRTSSDGKRWSRRRKLSSRRGQIDHAFPAVATGPKPGDFRVVWQDDGRGADHWNTWYRRTRDGGRTWQRRVRLSGRGDTASYDDGSGYAFPYGDYFRVAVDGKGIAHVIWGAGESFSGNGGAWYTSGR